jgi:M6 family metalloprotease-like protein
MKLNVKILACILFIILLFSSTTFAAPHITRSIPEPPEFPGRTLQERFAQGRPENMTAAAPFSYSVPQTVRILFLRVDFPSDQDPSTTGSGLWTDPLYAYNNDADYWVDRAKNRFPAYWSEVSYGLLTVAIDVSSKVFRLPQPMTYYAGGTAGPIQNLIYDSITTAATDTTTSMNFSLYDGVFIIHAGVGQETAHPGTGQNDLWSLIYSGGTKICRDAAGVTCLTTKLKDGKDLSEAIIMPQTDSRSGQTVDPFGVYVHEFGHWLGLPDLYCISSATSCPSEGVGNWSLMDQGSYNADPATCTPYCIFGSAPAHLDAWSLVYLGWVNPRTVNTYQSISLDPVESVTPSSTPAAGTDMVRATASTGTAQQYYLIENRQEIGFDVGLPGHGLLVWLIDDDVVNAGLNSNTINSGTRPGVKLIEADGDWSLQNPATNDFGSPGDPFPGSTANMNLTPVTNPPSIPYTNYGSVNIRNITEQARLMTFSIGFAPLPPTGLTVNAETKTLSWNASAGATDYYIYKNESRTRLGSTGAALSFVDSNYLATDYYEVSAVDANGNESQAATLGVPTTGTGTATTALSGAGGGGSSNGCFIATAAYGSFLDPHVESLRKFRDRYLLTNPVGRVIVSFYYKYSPPIAVFIGSHESLRTITRWALTPIVFAAEYPVLFIILFAMGALLAGRKIRDIRA